MTRRPNQADVLRGRLAREIDGQRRDKRERVDRLPEAERARRNRERIDADRARKRQKARRPRKPKAPRPMAAILHDLARTAAPWVDDVDWPRFAELETEMDRACAASEEAANA